MATIYLNPKQSTKPTIYGQEVPKLLSLKGVVNVIKGKAVLVGDKVVGTGLGYAVERGEVKAGTIALGTGGSGGAGAIKLVKGVTKELFKTPYRAGGTIVGAGALSVSPTLRKKAANLPVSLFEAGKTAGDIIEDKLKPSGGAVANALKTAGIVGAAAVGGAVVSKIVSGLGKSKKKEKTENGGIPTTGAVLTPLPASTDIATTTAKQQPLAPTTEELIEEPKATARAKETKPIRVNQKVNIAIKNTATGQRKRYLKNVVYA